MKLAIQGCSHGELDAIYASVLRYEQLHHTRVDALLLCGDFQAIRNHADLHCLAVPPKYRRLGAFHRYYSGQALAPVLTLVIGGNHEASNYLWELYHGGWIAPNIYYLGAAGAVDLAGLTVAGASGIFKSHDYHKGHFERLPYDNISLRSVYHTRAYDIDRLHLLTHADIVLSHDWPNTIEQHGDTRALIKKKPFFADEIKSHTLGSPPLMHLLQTLKPKYWFAAHLHVKFAALYKHSQPQPQYQHHNPEAIDISLDHDHDHDQAAAQQQPQTPAQEAAAAAVETTRFLALHKCLAQSDFLQFLDIPAPLDAQLSSDTEQEQRVFPPLHFNKRWLAITRATASSLSLTHHQPPLTTTEADIDQALAWVNDNIPSPLDIASVQQFARTAPAPFDPAGLYTGPPAWFTNPQTEALCRLLHIPNRINPAPPQIQQQLQQQLQQQQQQPQQPLPPPPPPPPSVPLPDRDPNQIDIDFDDEDPPQEDHQHGEPEPTTLDGPDMRWGEGAG